MLQCKEDLWTSHQQTIESLKWHWIGVSMSGMPNLRRTVATRLKFLSYSPTFNICNPETRIFLSLFTLCILIITGTKQRPRHSWDFPVPTHYNQWLTANDASVSLYLGHLLINIKPIPHVTTSAMIAPRTFQLNMVCMSTIVNRAVTTIARPARGISNPRAIFKM